MLKSYKYRIYPTESQKGLIDKTIGCCRLVYNLALEVKITAYKNAGVNLSPIDLCNQLPDLKREFPFLKEVDSQSLQAAVRKVDTSFKNFFRGAAYPKFKNKKKGAHSFRCPANARRVDWVNSTITLPKLPNIPAALSRRFEGKIKTCTVSRTPTSKYFVSILIDNDKQIPIAPKIIPETTIGIDVGISNYVISSDGKLFEPNRKLKENMTRLKILQRRSSRKVKGSANSRKANLQVAILHEKISNKRLDYIHKTTTALVHDSQVNSIAVENLNVSGMLKNKNLAQAISDVSFSELFRQLEYKCKWHGKNIIRIGRFDPSSKRCSNCGEINRELKLSDREWECSSCSITHDRDFNAALNIKHYGLQKAILNNPPVGSREEPVEQSALMGCNEAGICKEMPHKQ